MAFNSHALVSSGSVVELLEDRRLLSAAPIVKLVGNGLLLAHGRRDADTIVFSLESGDATKLDVTIDGATTTFNVADVKRILAIGGKGNDSITIDETNGAITIPAILIGGNGNDTLTGGSGNDILIGGNGNDVLSGGAGNDRIIGGNGDDVENGGDGNDILLGVHGNDTLAGGNGDDVLIGGGGADSLDGGDGNDVLIDHGRAGGTLTGGNGDDVFIAGKNETITDLTDQDTVIGRKK